MAIILRATDIAVLQALLNDGRKSFRQISREADLIILIASNTTIISFI
jgi:DNA-binding Lrp family transcriptional regulator